MITKIEANEVIACNSYVELCDFSYDYHNLESSPESGIIHVPTDQLDRFFQTNGDNGKNYTGVVFFSFPTKTWPLKNNF